VGLALVTFDVSPAAALGLVPGPSNTALSDENGNPIAIDSFVSGTIDATPEPSTAAMLLAALVGLGAWRLIGIVLASTGRMRC
jgi:MYXO-CTERM domain-containing protein